MTAGERRTVLTTSLAAAALVVVHSLLWDAARWNGETFLADSADLVAIGEPKADLFRFSLLADLFGSYLLTIPATYALWRLLRRERTDAVADLLGLGGLIYAVLGALAAAVFAEAGALLIQSFAREPGASTATQFAALNAAAVATWQIPCVVAGGAWWLGSGWLVRARWKWFARYSMAFGGLALVLGLLKIAGAEYNSNGPATAAFLPIAIWIGWLGVLLNRSA